MNKNTQIQAAQLHHILLSNTRTLAVSAVLASILVFMQREVIPMVTIATWFALLCVVIGLRFMLGRFYSRNPTNNSATIRARLIKIRLGVLAASLVWGAAAFVLFPESSPQHQMFLIFMLMGLSAGGIVAYSVDMPSAAIYSIFLVVPLMLKLLLLGSALSVAMGLAVMLYLVFMLASSRYINKSLIDNVVLRLDADARERVVNESEERYRLLLNYSPVGILHYDTSLKITYCNQKLADILHSSVERLINLDLNRIKDHSILPALNKALLGQTGIYEGAYTATFSNAKGWINLISATSRDSNGEVVGGIAIIQDATAHKRATEEIEQLAFYDPLTNLPNRRLLLDRLNLALIAGARNGKLGALLFLDLDHFKTLNDTLGHHFGDLLLQQVAQRLLRCVREEDTVARLGGDEYVVMLQDMGSHELEAAANAEAIGHKIINALNVKYHLGAHECHSTPSIGVVIYGRHEQTQEELLKYADIAMYQAKKSGRNQIRFFDPKMQEVISTRASLESELRKALELNQFQLYYQLQVDGDNRPLGAEALIRWMHPERGMVPPFDFIPLAEETGLIVPIGEWVLETACVQLGLWQQDEHTRHLTLSVNVSAKQFYQPDFVKRLENMLQRHAIDASRLKLELTESMLLDQLEAAVTTMNVLRDIGIRFSLDDFGTGYSSLQYLKKLPLYQLKIDQSFVRDIVADASDRAIVRTIIAMAQSLELDVIAEGVETEEQRQLLLSNSCDNFQGYLFSKPVPLEQFELLLGQNTQR